MKALAIIVLIGCQLSYADLPPIVDIYEASTVALEIEQLKAEIASLKQQLEQARSATAQQAPPAQKRAVPRTRRVKLFHRNPAQTQTPVDALPPHSDTSAKQDWQQVISLLKVKQYKSALKALQLFIQKYPAHSNKANAYYLLGQLALQTGDTTTSLNYFQSFIKQYPKDPRIPDAQLHMGLAYYAKQNNAMAHKLFTQLIQRYPQHPAAEQARENLNKLNIKATHHS
jgi:tol-pal system protein YbgF